MGCSRLYRLHCPHRLLLLQVAGEGGAKEPSLCGISCQEEIEQVCSLHHDKAEHHGAKMTLSYQPCISLSFQGGSVEVMQRRHRNGVLALANDGAKQSRQLRARTLLSSLLLSHLHPATSHPLSNMVKAIRGMSRLSHQFSRY